MKILLVATFLTITYLTKEVSCQDVSLNINIDELPSIPEEVDKWIELLNKHLGWGDKDKRCGWNDPVIFYEGNGCTQETVGSIHVKNKDGNTCTGINIKKWNCFDNDEARSLAILPTFPRDGVIWVCDNPDACSSDDQTYIVLKKSLAENEVYCVKGFEHGYEDDYVKVVHTHKNGLNGKVSRVSACKP